MTNLSDDTGSSVASYEYDAYGNVLATSGDAGNTYQFSSKEFEDHAGLIYFGARYYDPEIGRWLTPDPLGFIDGPNVYVYVSNNPLNLIDPLGFAGEKKGFSLIDLAFDSDTFNDSIKLWQVSDGGTLNDYGLRTISVVAILGTSVDGLFNTASFGAKGIAKKGLVTASKYFGSKSKRKIIKALTKKFGKPKSIRKYARTFYNPKTKRSFNVHWDPTHGKPHVDIRRRGTSLERKFTIGENR